MVADPDEQDTGHVGTRLRHHGFVERLLLRPDLGQRDLDELGPARLLLLLGSAAAVYDPARRAVVEAESALVRRALDRGVAVIGICYGAQLAAHALGGSVGPAARGEVGWRQVESTDELLCGDGPWLQFHSDVLVVPPGARTTGRTDCGDQGFVLDPTATRAGLVAWQFHPEATSATLARWVAQRPSFVAEHGGGDGVDLLSRTRSREDEACAAAGRLVDAALRHLGVTGATAPSATPRP